MMLLVRTPLLRLRNNSDNEGRTANSLRTRRYVDSPDAIDFVVSECTIVLASHVDPVGKTLL